MRAWGMALRPSGVECFEALHASGLTELVGREQTLESSTATLVEGEDR